MRGADQQVAVAAVELGQAVRRHAAEEGRRRCVREISYSVFNVQIPYYFLWSKRAIFATSNLLQIAIASGFTRRMKG